MEKKYKNKIYIWKDSGSMIEKFLELEHSLDLFSMTFKQFNYWTYIRSSVYSDIRRGVIDSSDSKPPLTEWTGKRKSPVMSKFLCFFRCVIKSPFFCWGKKDLLVYQDAIIYNPEHGYYECPPTQCVVDNYQGKLLLLQDCLVSYKNEPLQFPIARYVGIVYYKAKLKMYLVGLNKNMLQREKTKLKEEINSFINIFEKNYSVKLNVDKYVDSVYEQYFMYSICYKYFYKLLKRVKPKCIVEQCSYSFRNRVLNEVAEQLSIPTVEMQHGVIGAGHIEYNYLAKAKYKGFPQYIFVFSDYWKERARFPIPNDCIIATGYPNLESKVLKLKKNKLQKGKVVLLFISQNVDGALWAETFIDFTKNVCEYIIENKLEQYRILYKPHPRESSDMLLKYKMFKKYGEVISVVQSDEQNLYECFSKADVQLSIGSTGIFEGLAYGLSTFILKVELSSDVMKDLVESGYASWVSSPKDMFKKNGELNVETRINADFFWKENSINNIMEALEQIMKGKNVKDT